MSQLQNGFDAAKQITHTVLLFYRWFRSQPTAIPTPAGTRAGIGKRWVTVPATGRRHGRRHGRATKPITEGWQLSSQVIICTARLLNNGRCRFPPAGASM